ncbi:hypothetical protein BpHYR1_039008 [Brachionus plicatilis]|uniref:Fungal lipase-type domain-containing protein n=1 Tax=Brachionus plicatilis TaxID=10195 RepID=A0A3M7T1B3_BRAPC|nr:hypothetical protein BpHYR1_039008 [Brachionus plicatilis]
MKFSEREDQNEILLKSSIISIAVSESNPKKFLEINEEMRSIDYQIEEMCFSQSHNNQKVEYFNALNDICYLMVDDIQNNKLYICFRGTRNLKDLLVDAKGFPKISDINGRFHNGFYNRAQKVPKLYFIEKLEQGYELILTGHGLGAAVSANIAIHFLLYRLDISQKYAKKIIFIGFGCPSIADIYFKRNVENFNENFIFIKNENDIVVELLEYISHFIYKSDQNNNSNLEILIDFINGILRDKTDPERTLEKCNQMKAFIGTMAKIIAPEYTHFGTLYKLSRKDGLKEVLNFEFDVDLFSKMFNDPGLLIDKIQDHLIKNYFRNLKNTNYFIGRIDINHRNRKRSLKLSTYLNFEIKEKDIKGLRIIKMRDNTDIVLCINKSVKNTEYLVAIKLTLRLGYKETNGVALYFKNGTYEVLDDDSICFRFNCLNEKIYDKKNNLNIQNFVFVFYSHFNSEPTEVMINTESNKFRSNMKPGSYQKHKLIDNMRFDLLYLHAAYCLHALERMKDLNQNFIEVKNELFGIFESLDFILTEICDKKEKEIVYTKNDLNEMKSLVENYFNLIRIDNELENGFPSHLDYDKVYEYIIKKSRQIKNNVSDNESLYFYEKLYDEEFVNQWSESEDKLIFKLILLNKQLRDILKKNYIFGSIGTKNAGKSKFVELITSQDTKSSKNYTTTQAKAYSLINENDKLIFEKVVIIDYPHSNSNTFSQKLEFIFTRLLIDHIYLIFEAEAKGETDDQTRLINLVKTNNFSGFTILNNKADQLFLSNNQKELEKKKLEFATFKKEMIDNLTKKCVDLNSRSILFTCMDIKISRLNDDEKTAMEGVGVILSERMKRIVLEKIESMINLDFNRS